LAGGGVMQTAFDKGFSFCKQIPGALNLFDILKEGNAAISNI
jgi:hypothetical protein